MGTFWVQCNSTQVKSRQSQVRAPNRQRAPVSCRNGFVPLFPAAHAAVNPDFQFTVKLFQGCTHSPRGSVLSREGKLGADTASGTMRRGGPVTLLNLQKDQPRQPPSGSATRRWSWPRRPSPSASRSRTNSMLAAVTCQGCHGIAQTQDGFDFSFLYFGVAGKGFSPDVLGLPSIAAAAKRLENRKYFSTKIICSRSRRFAARAEGLQRELKISTPAVIFAGVKWESTTLV
jgi:hypothetical protein